MQMARRVMGILLAGALAGCGGDAPPRHVLLVTVDTLRADRLAAFGGEPGTTPRLDALAAESAVFPNAYAPTSFTLPSVAGLLTGIHPVRTGVFDNTRALPPGIPTLAALLREHGWRTGAVVSNWILRHGQGLAPGFEVYDARFPQTEAVRHLPERTAPHTTAAALAVFDALAADDPRTKIFLWVHYQDPHGPYTPPEALRERFLARARAQTDGTRTLPESADNGGRGAIPRYQLLGDRRDVAFYRAGYDAEVAVTDRAIGALLDGLARRGVTDPIVVFAADHGESLGENDLWFAHGAGLSEVEVRVPLMIRVPGRPAERRPGTASLLDVAPTLLALLDVPPPARQAGRDLLATPPGAAESEVFLSTLGAVDPPIVALVAEGNRVSWTREPGGGWSKRVHASTGPAGELPAEVVADLNARLEQRVTGRPPVRPRAPAPASPEERERLRALGYLD